MKIQDVLVWDKHSGDLIGFVDLGNTKIIMATMQDSDEIATHVLVFIIRGIVNPFATTNATALQIFQIFWKTCSLCVVAACCNSASSKR